MSATTKQARDLNEVLSEALREIQSARSAIDDAEWAVQDAQKIVDPAAADDTLVADLLLLHKQLARDSVFAPRTPQEFQERIAQILQAGQVSVDEIVMAR